jgi:hypothetical protein
MMSEAIQTAVRKKPLAIEGTAASGGHQAPIAAARWRADDGLVAVLTGRIKIAPPDGISATEGAALVKEVDLIEWMSIHSPKPFSQVGVSVAIRGYSAPSQNVAVDRQPPSLSRSRDEPVGPVRVEGGESPNGGENVEAMTSGGVPADLELSNRGHAGRNTVQPPVAAATLSEWYIGRRDRWPANTPYPSQDMDLADARQQFSEHHVTREAVRTVRSRHAPEEWIAKGRRKLAPE